MSLDLIIATGMLLVIGVAGRFLAGTWLSPGPFFALIWGFIVLLSLSGPLFGAPQYPVWAGSVWWIDIQVSMLLIGDLVGQGGFRRSPRLIEPPSVPAKGLPYARSILLVCAACTFIYIGLLNEIEGRGEQPPTPLQLILALHFAGG